MSDAEPILEEIPLKPAPTHFVLHCPGPHGRGCGRNAHARVLLTLLTDMDALRTQLEAAGWSLAVGAVESDHVFDPVCDRCAARILGLQPWALGTKRLS